MAKNSPKKDFELVEFPKKTLKKMERVAREKRLTRGELISQAIDDFRKLEKNMKKLRKGKAL